MMMTMKGEGKPPSRRCSLAVPPLPLFCPDQLRPSLVLLFFSISDLLELELTAAVHAYSSVDLNFFEPDLFFVL
ncbi:uncharacterized protein DS421_17g571320 [Arachis hypogaea]|nr:uncharacterized protein DS421_17g571320 [Arachis hypogaea]